MSLSGGLHKGLAPLWGGEHNIGDGWKQNTAAGGSPRCFEVPVSLCPSVPVSLCPSAGWNAVCAVLPRAGQERCILPGRAWAAQTLPRRSRRTCLHSCWRLLVLMEV